MVDQVAKKLGIKVEKGKRTWLKTVNSKEVPTIGLGWHLEVRIGQWASPKTVETIALDDYDFIIGLDFLDKINALVAPFADCFCMLEQRC